jgi:hypothetical protein
MCDDIGCADGEREGFVDRDRFPNIASCVADWLGVANMRAPRSDEFCGDDLGQCNRPADACMRGWHICMTDGNSDDLSQHIEGGDCDGATGGQGAFAGASSHCSVRQDCGYDEPLPCFTNGYCSEAVCCGTDCAFGACADGVFEGQTPMIPGGGRGCGRTGNNADGVICCRD